MRALLPSAEGSTRASAGTSVAGARAVESLLFDAVFPGVELFPSATLFPRGDGIVVPVVTLRGTSSRVGVPLSPTSAAGASPLRGIRSGTPIPVRS